MQKKTTYPVAMTIAGSDSGGGAGIQADLKTFAALRVHGTTVITCLTAQNPRTVTGVQACQPGFVRQQLETVCAAFPPAAVKTGMLYNRGIIQAVAAFLQGQKKRPILVVDPVLVATSGARLLQPEAVAALKRELFPLASLLTPNIPEAEALTGAKIREPEDMRQAARQLQREFGCAVLLKGGHLHASREALDIFYDGREELLLSAPRIGGIKTHGTGCTYSAAIAGHCALGKPLAAAVRAGKNYVFQTIARSYLAGRFPVLNHTGQ